MARLHVWNCKWRVTLITETRMYVDEQAACDAKTCMTDVGLGEGVGVGDVPCERLIQSVRSNNHEQPLMAHK